MARDMEDDDNSIDTDLEEEDEQESRLRELRFEQLKSEMKSLQERKASQFGQYEEIVDEKSVMQTTASEKACVVHFYHPDFRRCGIMDTHLKTLAQKYVFTRFVRVFVEKVPWLVQRLDIKVLPCVMVFIDGKIKDKMVGFEFDDKAGNPVKDSFHTGLLEMRLAQTGVLSLKPRFDNNREMEYEYS